MIVEVKNKRELRALLNKVFSYALVQTYDLEWEYDVVRYVLEEVESDAVDDAYRECCHKEKEALAKQGTSSPYVSSADAKELRKKGLDMVLELDDALFPALLVCTYNVHEEIPIRLKLVSRGLATSKEDFIRRLKEYVKVESM